MPQTAPPSSNSISVWLLAIAAFVIVSTEFLIVGLIPSLSQDLQISIPLAGQLVTLFAVTVAVAGPFLTVMLSHLDRKKLFISILVLFAFSNALAAMAPNIWILGLARFLPALALPVFWGTASETAGELAGPERAAKAVSSVYLGISAALVFGIPIGTLASHAFGWRSSFWGLSVLSLFMAVALFYFMPKVAKPKKVRITEQLRILKDRFFLGNILLSVLVFTAMFTSYTYLADMLERLAEVPSANVGWWLMGFGAIGLVGNWLGGHFVGNSPLRATIVVTLVLIVGMATFTSVATSPWLALSIIIWGIANTALYPICQIRVMKAASHAQALAGTLNVSMANIGIGLGAVIGGFTIENYGLSNLGYVASVVAIAAVLLGLLLTRMKPVTRLVR